MSTLANFVQALSIVTDVKVGELKLVARTLREAGLIPQYGRGLHAAELEPTHVAQLLMGMLIGRRGPVHRVAQTVRSIGDLRKRDGVTIALAQAVTDTTPSTQVTLLPQGGSFLNALADILSALAAPESDSSWHGVIQSVGMKFGSGLAYPWIQFKDSRRIRMGLTRADQCAFGPARLLHRVDTGGLIEESQVPSGVLLNIALLLREGPTPAQQISYLMEFTRKARLR